MVLRWVRPDDDHQAGLLDVRDGARVSAVSHGALQAHRRRVLAVAGAVVDVVRADHRARKLLHQEALFVGALRGGNERQRIGTVLAA